MELAKFVSLLAPNSHFSSLTLPLNLSLPETNLFISIINISIQIEQNLGVFINEKDEARS